ncbi:transcription elongation factor Spt5 [Ignicoccus hospitalis]|uniref:Transcription elongation factor Spt5 n=1 Tax=Ignicoccus hospitalis (strain KIN4/I / DSM 18386 / JCM 14125) TaxID=453591 RepID=A8ABQ4_IGNH4|nr:NGN domain protein [Ignicoccus hospitalis KIN4/I]HIH89706.1 transcription elongation factor Spt5 [Desulfurococcaceae archaeon]
MGVPFFPVRTVSGREIDVALLIEERARAKNLDVKSVIVPPRIKGFVIVESPAHFVVAEAVRGIKYVRGGPGKKISLEEVLKMIKPVPIIETVEVGDIVELVAGVFKGVKARVEAKIPEKNELVLSIVEAAYPLQITVPADYVRPVRR